MKLYITTTKALFILLLSTLVVSCGDSSERSDDDVSNDTVISNVNLKPKVAFVPQHVNVSVGESFKLDINMSDFPVSEGGGFSLDFNPSQLNVSEVAINVSNWDFVNKEGSIDNNAGVVSDVLFSSYKGVSGNNQIATVTFKAIASGSSEIALKKSSVNPFSSGGEEVVTKFVGSYIQISAAQ